MTRSIRRRRKTCFAIEWILANTSPRPTTSAECLYDEMESQCSILPVIYVPFDGTNRNHFKDRGRILDYTAHTQGGRVLDLGPGDGWPSLLLAPMVEEVIGVDGSWKRVEVCTRNARRMGLNNASFRHVPPGQALPFHDGSFDCVTAGASIEQTPDANETLKELYRILKPGGRLRMHYESLSYYAGEPECEFVIGGDESASNMTIYDRNIADETVTHYQLKFKLSRASLEELIAINCPVNTCAGLSADAMETMHEYIVDSFIWSLRHPSCNTLLRWLPEIGFRDAKATYDGGWFADNLFGRLSDSTRPCEIDEVDQFLRPIVEVIVTMDTPHRGGPRDWDPWVTAVK